MSPGQQWRPNRIVYVQVEVQDEVKVKIRVAKPGLRLEHGFRDSLTCAAGRSQAHENRLRRRPFW